MRYLLKGCNFIPEGSDPNVEHMIGLVLIIVPLRPLQILQGTMGPPSSVRTSHVWHTEGIIRMSRT